MKIPEKFDLVVVGGGPAGSVAARFAAQKGVRTLLIEKDRDFGIPVRCAEGIGLGNLSLFVEPSSKWIENELAKVRLYAPDGTQLHINLQEKGAIINRKVFDFELARLAAEAGAVVRNRCCAVGLSRENGHIRLKFEHFGEEYSVKSPLVIGADGVESRVARWAGINSSLPPIDIETCFQYTLHHPTIDNECCDFHFGRKIAPSGYIWIFPKGKKTANVGIGVAASATKNKSAREFIDDFIESHYPGASYLSSIAGAVPAMKTMKKMITDNVMIVGDAAYQANPLTGGGIMSAMWGGKYAGETAAEALEKGDFSAKILSSYSKLYNHKIGDTYNRHYRLKRAVHKLPDEVLNRTAALMKELPIEERTMRRIFQTALKNEPGLVVDIMKAFLPY